MWPVVGTFAGFELHTWGLLGALGFLVVAVGGLRRCRALGIPAAYAADALIATGVGGLLGARLLYAVQSPGGAPVWDLRAGGASFFGALLLAIPAGTLVARWRGLDVAATWDAFASPLPFGFALSRLGCLAAGCCYGRPTTLPWGIDLPGHGVVHPTELYEALWQLALGVGVNAGWRRLRRTPGAVAAAWIAGTALGRLWIEVLRGDPGRGTVGPLTVPQALSLALLAAVGAWMLAQRHGPSVASG